ncbi:ATP-grasp domain-containing protein [Oceanobacillus profundus]|uniref:ATP-grasp domain-containing protein n=1 Tax=Oceanobacillus profundus TaxID=372463 RepID=A0A417YP97_9BACI|nr:ATP-grasp domain-containing protein [Oceanobacillus profundus]RHW35509.1 ATP-grasp domain-containing protein [Oceanobacillus profundus]
MNYEHNWLPELEGTVPKEAYGYALSNYTIAYEAWRRGLSITFENLYHNKGMYYPIYSIYNNDNKVQFTHTRPHLVSKDAVDICVNKQRTRETLDAHNVPVPKGRLLKSLAFDQVKKQISDLSFPLVIKPLAGAGGRGVITGIDSFDELMENIQYLTEKLNYHQIIVEEYITGEDYRAFVIGDKVVGAFRRLPPHVIGDGKSTIRELLKKKNKFRVNIPGTYDMKVLINEEIKRELNKQNLTLKSIPEKDQFVRLKTKNNVSSGGDPIDATHELSEDLKENLVKAVQAIPGLIQGGVDVIYDKESGRYAILEINTKPSIRNHLYPIKGNAHEIPKSIIDYYFPETKGKYLSETTPKYYFDYSFVKEYLQNNRLKKFTLPTHPYEPNLISKLITFQSDHELAKLKQMIRTNFHKLKFNGEMNLISTDQYEIILAGNYQDVEQFIDFLKSKKFISNVQNEHYQGGVRVGYSFNYKPSEEETVTDAEGTSSLSPIEEKDILASIEEKDKRIKELENEIIQLKNSKSWTVTAPLRKLSKKLNK